MATAHTPTPTAIAGSLVYVTAHACDEPRRDERMSSNADNDARAGCTGERHQALGNGLHRLHVARSFEIAAFGREGGMVGRMLDDLAPNEDSAPKGMPPKKNLVYDASETFGLPPAAPRTTA